MAHTEIVRLESIAIEGYKRFDAKSILRTRGKVSCLVGPNEAGKTSLLEALAGLFEQGWPGPYVFSGRVTPDDDSVILSARYRLEDEDFKLAEELLEGRRISGALRGGDLYVETRKDASGAYGSSLFNAPSRDLDARHKLGVQLEEASRGAWLEKVAEKAPSLHEELLPMWQSLVEDLTSEERDLSEEVVERLRLVIEALDRGASEFHAELDDEHNRALSETREHIVKVHADESLERPGQVLVGELVARCPRFLLFDGRNRDLPSFHPFGTAPPQALLNLLALAEIDFEQLSAAGAAGDRARLGTMQMRGNAALAKALELWSQDDLAVTLDLSTDGIEIHVLERRLSELTRLEERSAGLRMYVALLAFVNAHQAESGAAPILLIDEAEMHLHYDAQANLVQALHKQDIAQHVIYSTHSVGCLPEDLGITVKAIDPIAPRKSIIRQTAWVDGFGLTPLMAAMGATTFAFVPARSALIVEGMIDALVLPRLFRDALEDDRLHMGFQVVPGLSEVPRELAEQLDAHAGTVLYLSDDDEGGRRHRAKIPEAAKQAGRMFILGGGERPGLCVEDLIEPEVLTEAMTRVARTHDVEIAATELELPEVGRGKWIEEVLAARGLSVTRTLVAYAILDHDRHVLSAAFAELVRDLFAGMRAKIPQ